MNRIQPNQLNWPGMRLQTWSCIVQGPVQRIPSVLSRLSEERSAQCKAEHTAFDGEKMLPCSILPPSIEFFHRPQPLRSGRLPRCQKLYSSRSEFVSLFIN